MRLRLNVRTSRWSDERPTTIAPVEPQSRPRPQPAGRTCASRRSVRRCFSFQVESKATPNQLASQGKNAVGAVSAVVAAGVVLAALRNEFGGHALKERE